MRIEMQIGKLNEVNEHAAKRRSDWQLVALRAGPWQTRVEMIGLDCGLERGPSECGIRGVGSRHAQWSGTKIP